MLVDLQARHILVDGGMNSWSRRRIIPGAARGWLHTLVHGRLNPMLGFTGLGRNYYTTTSRAITSP